MTWIYTIYLSKLMFKCTLSITYNY